MTTNDSTSENDDAKAEIQRRIAVIEAEIEITQKRMAALRNKVKRIKNNVSDLP